MVYAVVFIEAAVDIFSLNNSEVNHASELAIVNVDCSTK